MSDMTLSQTKSLKAFLKESGVKNFKQFFTKHVENETVNCTFFTLVPDQGEKITGLVAKTIDEPVNCQQAVSSGNYEVSLFTSLDDEGEVRSTWLIHKHQSDGTAGADEEIDFG